MMGKMVGMSFAGGGGGEEVTWDDEGWGEGTLRCDARKMTTC